MSDPSDTPSAIDAMVDQNVNLREEIDEKDDLLDAATKRAETAEVELERASRRVGYAGDAPSAAVDATDSAADDEVGVVADEADGPTEVEMLRAERDTYLADSQRLAADFSNFRKQSEKRVADAAASQSASLVRDLIAVLDACDSALAQDSDSAVAPIRSALLGELERNGLEVVSPEPDAPFDPEMHEAVMHELAGDDAHPEGDAPTQRVAELFRAGYAWKGRVVRPAMVKVVG